MKKKPATIAPGTEFYEHGELWTVQTKYPTPGYWTCIHDQTETTKKVHEDEIRVGVYPETYLHVRDCRSGQEWIEPISGNALMDITKRVKAWVKKEFCGELRMDGKIMPRLDGGYYAQIKTDGRPPESVVCWESGGFYLTDGFSS